MDTKDIKDFKMGIELEKLNIFTIMKDNIKTKNFVELFKREISSNFIKQKPWREENELIPIDKKEFQKIFKEESSTLYLEYDNIVFLMFMASEDNLLKWFAISLKRSPDIERKLILEKIKGLIFKIKYITNPLYIRTAHDDGSGDPIEQEKLNQKIFSLHWMQIFSKEMLHSINVDKLKNSDKFYEVQDLPDGSIFIQITEDFGYTDPLIKELSDEIEIDCPEIYRWWDPQEI